MSGLFRLLIVPTLVALVATGAALAATSAVDSHGTVHSVERVVWTDGILVGGPALRYVTQTSDGGFHAEFVPGTYALPVDREPSLALDPVTERQIVVWSRTEGGDRDVWLTRLDEDGWHKWIPIADGPGDQFEPQLTARRELVHIVWKSVDASGRTTPTRLSLWRASLDPAFGPEILPRETGVTVSADGGLDPDPESATADLTYFASILESSASGEETVVVWGIRDEPLPITYVQSFEVGQGHGLSLIHI